KWVQLVAVRLAILLSFRQMRTSTCRCEQGGRSGGAVMPQRYERQNLGERRPNLLRQWKWCFVGKANFLSLLTLTVKMGSMRPGHPGRPRTKPTDTWLRARQVGTTNSGSGVHGCRDPAVLQ